MYKAFHKLTIKAIHRYFLISLFKMKEDKKYCFFLFEGETAPCRRAQTEISRPPGRDTPESKQLSRQSTCTVADTRGKHVYHH